MGRSITAYIPPSKLGEYAGRITPENTIILGVLLEYPTNTNFAVESLVILVVNMPNARSMFTYYVLEYTSVQDFEETFGGSPRTIQTRCLT